MLKDLRERAVDLVPTLSFNRPDIGGSDRRTIIGFREGRSADLLAQDLDVFENAAWTQPNKRREEFVMEGT